MKQTEDAPKNFAKPTRINTHTRASPSTKLQARDQQLFQKVILQNPQEHLLPQSISGGSFRTDKKCKHFR